MTVQLQTVDDPRRRVWTLPAVHSHLLRCPGSCPGHQPAGRGGNRL